MNINDESFHSGHRERLRQKFLDGKLAGYELLELALSFVIPRRDVRPLARRILQQFGGMYQVLAAPISELMRVPGVGKNTAIFIKTMHSVMLDGFTSAMQMQPIFHDDKILTNFCRMQLMGKRIEEFHVLYLDRQHRMLAHDLHSLGTSDWAAVYPMEILRRALDLHACHLVLMHNHPTPNMSFSTDDIEMTHRLAAMAAPLDIKIYDHYLVSGDILYSARAMSILK